MKRFIFKRGGLFFAIIQSNIFQNRPGKVCLLLAVLLLLSIPGTPASAAVEGFVVKSSDKDYYQYRYEDLLDSYAGKLLGRPDGLYEDFAANKPYALLDNVSGYVDYADILDQYARVLIRGEKFNLQKYIQSQSARKAVLPPAIKMVSLSAGKLIRVEKNLEPDNPSEDPAEEITDPNPEPETPASAAPIVSSSAVSLARAQQWAAGKGAHQRFIDIAPLYWEYGKKTGISPEVMYAQSAHETGYGRYTGIVPPEYNNWAGIKTATATGDKPEDHEQFATPEDGVRAHFNHMSAYVGLSPIGEPHGRYHLVVKLSWAGTVKTVEELNGKWAPSPTYHERIVNMLDEMKQ